MRRMLTRRRMLATDEGNITLLTLGFIVVALLVVLVAAAATSVHLQRMRLMHVADELALDAADSLDIAAYYDESLPSPGDQGAVALARQRMQAQVDAAVAESAARHHLEDVTVVLVDTADGFTARVVVRTTAALMFSVDALAPWSDGIVLTAEASARAW